MLIGAHNKQSHAVRRCLDSCGQSARHLRRVLAHGRVRAAQPVQVLRGPALLLARLGRKTVAGSGKAAFFRDISGIAVGVNVQGSAREVIVRAREDVGSHVRVLVEETERVHPVGRVEAAAAH